MFQVQDPVFLKTKSWSVFLFFGTRWSSVIILTFKCGIRESFPSTTNRLKHPLISVLGSLMGSCKPYLCLREEGIPILRLSNVLLSVRLFIKINAYSLCWNLTRKLSKKRKKSCALLLFHVLGLKALESEALLFAKLHAHWNSLTVALRIAWKEGEEYWWGVTRTSFQSWRVVCWLGFKITNRMQFNP